MVVAELDPGDDLLEKAPRVVLRDPELLDDVVEELAVAYVPAVVRVPFIFFNSPGPLFFFTLLTG